MQSIARHDAEPEAAFGIGLRREETDSALPHSAMPDAHADVDLGTSGRGGQDARHRLRGR